MHTNEDLFKLKITRTETWEGDNPAYLFSIAFSLKTTDNVVTTEVLDISSTDFEQYIFTPFLFTVTKNDNTINLYKNNTLIASSSDIQSGIPSYDNSYITNTLEGYITGKYVKEIIVIKEAINSEQLYYITNLTDTNF